MRVYIYTRVKSGGLYAVDYKRVRVIARTVSSPCSSFSLFQFLRLPYIYSAHLHIERDICSISASLHSTPTRFPFFDIRLFSRFHSRFVIQRDVVSDLTTNTSRHPSNSHHLLTKMSLR